MKPDLFISPIEVQCAAAMERKPCLKCGGTEFLARGRCKGCHDAYQIAYRQINRERIKKRKAADRQKNKEAINALTRKRYAENIEKIRAQKKASDDRNREKKRAMDRVYGAKNRAKSNARSKAWKLANPERKKANEAKWRRNNPELARNISRNAYTTRRRRAVGKLSKGIEAKLFALQRGKCACCGLSLGKNYHVDHVMPLARGGTNTDDNVQLLRQSCNAQKHAKHPVDYMQEKGFLL